jgi:D-galactarolactone cycloisomerase
MKIANAETILLSMPFEAGGTPPWSFGGKPANSFDILLVRLETNDGLVGWGEAFSRGRDIALKQTMDTRLLPLILALLWQIFIQAACSHRSIFGSAGIAAAAVER